jgi:hypothetical protein
MQCERCDEQAKVIFDDQALCLRCLEATKVVEGQDGTGDSSTSLRTSGIDIVRAA